MIGIMTRLSPFPPGFPQTPEDQRRVAEDLCHRVCEISTDPALTPAYKALQSKYQRSKAKLKAEQEKNRVLSDERLRDHQQHEERMQEVQLRIEELLKRHAEELAQRCEAVEKLKAELATPSPTPTEPESDSSEDTISYTIDVARKGRKRVSPQRRVKRRTTSSNAQNVSEDLKLLARAVSNAFERQDRSRRSSPGRTVTVSPRKVPVAHRREWPKDENG
jgi:nucleotidyltransferase/DNA polymerase involved in DNA repair